MIIIWLAKFNWLTNNWPIDHLNAHIAIKNFRFEIWNLKFRYLEGKNTCHPSISTQLGMGINKYATSICTYRYIFGQPISVSTNIFLYSTLSFYIIASSFMILNLNMIFWKLCDFALLLLKLLKCWWPLRGTGRGYKS